MMLTDTLKKRVAALLLALLLWLPALPGADASSTPEYNPDRPENLLPDHLTCTSAILIEASSGEVIFEKNADARIYPASTTKILTTYLGLMLDDPDRRVVVSASAMDIPEDSSTIPLSYGEEVRFMDVLYTTMLKSGNEGANVIAETVAGDSWSFVAWMNKAAESFGCTGTNFANPHGYHDENHYSTARDMALIARVAMQDERFRDIVSQTEYIMPEDNIYKERRLRTNNRFMVASDNSQVFYPYGIGIKTGNHSAAGYCYIGAAERDGVMLISCVFHARSDDARYTDTIKLLEYGFTQFKGITVAELYALNPKVVDIASYALTDTNLGRLTLALRKIPAESEGKDTIVASISNIDYMSRHMSDFTLTEYTRAFSAPVDEGEVMGRLTYYDSEGLPTVYELVATRSIQRREQLAPTIEDIIAYTEADRNPFPRFTFEFALLYIILPLTVLTVIVRLFRGLTRRRRRKRKRMRNVAPKERYYR